MPQKIDSYLFCVIVYFCAIQIPINQCLIQHKNSPFHGNYEDCWLTLNAEQHFKTMENLERKYEMARRDYDKQQFFDKYDEEILGTLLADSGATNRETQKHGNQRRFIPSGLNLGGHTMMRMNDSIMFFHRMKLRNDTSFRVNYLQSNFSSMIMTARLALHDLHLIGTYERVQTSPDSPSTLYYTPSHGEIEIMLRDVLFKMEGRYRLQKNVLFLEMILSDLFIPYNGIIMSYKNANSLAAEQDMVSLQAKHIADFLDRMKTDLNWWLKDFFNEFLLNNPPLEIPSQSLFLKYDKKRILTVNKYVDDVLAYLIQRMEKLHDESVKLPHFSIYTFNGYVLEMTGGSLNGLNTMYRRSMATNTAEGDLRKVDALIAFSNLNVRYSYEFRTTTGAPPLYGNLILSADELSTIMSVRLAKDPPFADLKFDSMQQLKAESLVVEGSVASVIANFKHLLEMQIIAIMTNTMIDQVKQLKSLAECVPTLVPAEEQTIDSATESDYGEKSKKKQRRSKGRTGFYKS